MQSWIYILLLAFSFQAAAQPEGPSNGSNIAGDYQGPGSLKINSHDGKFLKWIGRRVHTLQSSGVWTAPNVVGPYSKNYIVAFDAEGAMVYHSELVGSGLNQSDDISAMRIAGRNTGLQLLPYSISFATDGSYRIQVSTAALRNMNSHLLQANSYNDWDDSDAWKWINNIDFLSLTVDQNRTHNGVYDIEFSIFRFKPVVGIASWNVNRSYIAANANVGVGFGFSKMTLPGNPGQELSLGSMWGAGQKYPEQQNGLGARVHYGAGLELVQKVGKNGKLIATAGFEGGTFRNGYASESLQNENLDLLEKYKTKVANYQRFQNEKAQYEKNSGFTLGSVSDEQYSALTGKPLYKEPVEPTYKEPTAAARRQLGYVHSSVELSQGFRTAKNNPLRVGVRLNYTKPLYDESRSLNYDDFSFDFQERFRMIGSGTIFLNF